LPNSSIILPIIIKYIGGEDSFLAAFIYGLDKYEYPQTALFS